MPEPYRITLRVANPAWMNEIQAYRKRHGLETLVDVIEHAFARANAQDGRATPDRANAKGRPIGYSPTNSGK